MNVKDYLWKIGAIKLMEAEILVRGPCRSVTTLYFVVEATKGCERKSSEATTAIDI